MIDDAQEYHSLCSKKFFGQPVAPELPYSESDMEELAGQVVRSHMAVTGVQRKLSLDIAGAEKGEPRRLTVVGLWGAYILKPPSPDYPGLPEVEDLTMHMAEMSKISVVPHSLIRLQSGNLAYITKRIDRVKKAKLHMEDMCQLTERLTADKYRGSYEQIAKAIQQYSAYPGLDLVNFAEQILFSFLTGNADMHLKNFSLLYKSGIGPLLSPGYDMVATALVNPADREELALTLNGRKNKLTRQDFEASFGQMGLDTRQQANIFRKMLTARSAWQQMIDNSFLSPDHKIRFKSLLDQRFERLK